MLVGSILRRICSTADGSLHLHFPCFFHSRQLLLLVALALLQLEPRLVLNLGYLVVGRGSFRLQPSHGLTCSSGKGGRRFMVVRIKRDRCCRDPNSAKGAQKPAAVAVPALKPTSTTL